MKKIKITPFLFSTIVGISVSIVLAVSSSGASSFGLVTALWLFTITVFLFAADRILVVLLSKREFAFKILIIVELVLIAGFVTYYFST